MEGTRPLLQQALKDALAKAARNPGNAGDVQLLPSLARLAAHASPLVRAGPPSLSRSG